MKKLKLIDNISGLQLFQVMKAVIFFIISVVLTKSKLTSYEIGQFEGFMFIAGIMTFFWVTGILQSLLPLYNRNKTYGIVGENSSSKSPEIFNAFLLLSFFSLLIFFLGHIFKNDFSVFHNRGNVPFINLLLLYILLSSPVCLIEYIYLLNKRSYRIFQYGVYTFSAQLLLVIIPILLGKDLIWAIYGLLVVSLARWVWLVILLRRYSEFKFSFEFIKEHMYLGTPLIITTLISGSAQYIDGFIVSTVFRDPAMFAWFRYGAKEFPLVLMLANGLHGAMLSEFATREKMKESLEKIREKSLKLMHLLFPATAFMMLIARWGYPIVFREEFHKSSSIFLVYSLMIIPRLVFPQTILVGRQKTNVILGAAVLELAVNIPLSLLMIRLDYGLVGVALASFVGYFINNLYLVLYIWAKMKIRPADYIPVKAYLLYTLMIGILFILIDHRIIDIS